MIWKKTLHGETPREADGILEPSDRRCLVFISCDGDNGLRLVKLDSRGDSDWKRTCRAGECEFLIEDPDGGFTVGGSIVSGRAFSGCGNVDIYAFKINLSGDLLAEGILSGKSGDGINFMCPTTSGGYIAVGNSFSFENGTIVLMKLPEWETAVKEGEASTSPK